MSDFIVIVIIGLILTLALRYIIKEKNRGVQCIGCPVTSCSQTSCESMKEYYMKVK